MTTSGTSWNAGWSAVSTSRAKIVNTSPNENMIASGVFGTVWKESVCLMNIARRNAGTTEARTKIPTTGWDNRPAQTTEKQQHGEHHEQLMPITLQ